MPAWEWLGIAVLPLFCFCLQDVTHDASSNPAAIYSKDPQDSWNRVFRALFTRTITTRLTNEHAEAGPFPGRAGFQHIPVSRDPIKRWESGDHAIEPLYPSFLNLAGPNQVLTGQYYSEFAQALKDALAEPDTRPPLARALMQADAWAAYDILFRYPLCRACGGITEPRTPRERLAAQHREQLLALLGTFLHKVALTTAEIRSLARNYSATDGLPPLFDSKSGWMEIQWSPERSHDADAGYRRVTRVFLKPASPPANKEAFVNSLRQAGDVSAKLDAVALVIENLVLDVDGNVVPSPITYDVQIRRFVRNSAGKVLRAEVEEHELSRERILQGRSMGLVRLGPGAPAYLSVAGNDYGFATPQFQPDGDLPVLGTLNSRCASCHSAGAGAVFTFAAIFPDKLPSAKTMPVDKDERALYVAQRKIQREDYRSLRAAWGP